MSGYHVAFAAAAAMLGAGALIMVLGSAHGMSRRSTPTWFPSAVAASATITTMTAEERHFRADAARNRKRLIEAATTLFRERGLEVGVGEIAEAAGVGRGTLFRNFASKEDLIAAVVADGCTRRRLGRGLLDAPDAADALFEFLAEMIGRQQLDRGGVGRDRRRVARARRDPGRARRRS